MLTDLKMQDISHYFAKGLPVTYVAEHIGISLGSARVKAEVWALSEGHRSYQNFRKDIKRRQMENFSSAVFQRLVESGMRQTEFARYLGLKPNTLRTYLNARSIPEGECFYDLVTLLRIDHLMGVDEDA